MTELPVAKDHEIIDNIINQTRINFIIGLFTQIFLNNNSSNIMALKLFAIEKRNFFQNHAF